MASYEVWSWSGKLMEYSAGFSSRENAVAYRDRMSRTLGGVWSVKIADNAGGQKRCG